MSKTLTRADLAEAVYRNIGLSRNESAELVETFLEEMCACLEKGEEVKLSPPTAEELPSEGFESTLEGFIQPILDAPNLSTNSTYTPVCVCYESFNRHILTANPNLSRFLGSELNSLYLYK